MTAMIKWVKELNDEDEIALLVFHALTLTDLSLNMMATVIILEHGRAKKHSSMKERLSRRWSV